MRDPRERTTEISPPYTTLSATIFALPAAAFSSSIQSGWYQCSCGMRPKETGTEMALLIFLSEELRHR